MPNFKNHRSGKYGSHSLAYQVEKAYYGMIDYVQLILSEEEREKLTTTYQNYFNSFKNNDTVYSKYRLEKQDYSSDPEMDQMGYDILDKLSSVYRLAKVKLGNNVKLFGSYYETLGTILDPAGDLMEAQFDSQYLFYLNQMGGAPAFHSKSAENIYNGLLGEKDEKTGEYKGPYKQLMDYYKSFDNLLKVEFTRQKLAKEGWTDLKERAFLEELKQKQQEAVDKFEKLYNVEDNRQYDEYLDNPLCHITGKYGSGRSAYEGVGVLRGQIKAIENGWGQDELVVLGSVGHMEAALKLARHEFEDFMISHKEYVEKNKDKRSSMNINEAEAYDNYVEDLKHEETNRKKYDELEKKLQELKTELWNTKVNSPEQKRELTTKVQNFINEQKDFSPVHFLSKFSLGESFEKQLIFVNEALGIDYAQREQQRFAVLHNKMEQAKVGVYFGTKEFDNIVTGVENLGKLMSGDKAVKDAAYKQVKADLQKYLKRKNKEIEGDEAEGKLPNANSVMRRDTMQNILDELTYKFEGILPKQAVKIEEKKEVKEVSPEMRAKREKKLSEAVDYYQALQSNVRQARGILSDSPEYTRFSMAVDHLLEVTRNMEKAYKSGSKLFDENKASKVYSEAILKMKERAYDYKAYKSEKKVLNSDDKRKMAIIDSVLSNRNKYFKQFKVDADKIPQKNKIVENRPKKL